MDYSRLVKLNQGLLCGTALLGLGSIVATALGGPVLTGLASFSSGIVGNNLGTLVERFRNSSEVLRNEDIAKAAGRTVAKALAEKISLKYPDKESLNKFAAHIEDYWVKWAEQAKTQNLFDTLQEQQLYKIFSQQPEHFSEYQVLPEDEWREVVTWLFQQGCENQVLGDSLDGYQDVIDELAAELAKNFNKHLRQVLKDDAYKGGRAFAEMLFDLHGATLAKIEGIQQYLPQLATREDFYRALQQLETGIRDELAHQFREIFQQCLDLNQPRLPIPQYCEALITEKTQDFVGRRFVFDALGDFLEKKPKGYFVLEADPGVGKTAIMARLVQVFKGSCLTHFNIQAQGIVKPEQFLENICTQLIQRYNLGDSRLPERATEDGNVLAHLLAEAAKKLAPAKKLVVVVDALDEVDSSSQIKGSNILYLPDYLADNVYFILSKRPQQLALPSSDYLTTFDLMQHPAESAEDARFYADKRYQQSSQIQEWVTSRQLTPEQFLTTLVNKSADPIKGVHNFMYLRYVLNDIESGLYESETLESLPEGLRRYYQKHWQLMGMTADPLPIDKIRTIYVMALVRKAVSLRLLAKLAEIAEHQLRLILRQWEQFLRSQQVEKETRYTIYHASFSDFLKEEAEDSGVDLQDIKRRIAENLSKGAPL